MIKNNNSQINSTHNLVKKASMLRFGYRLAVAATLATTIQSCGSSVGYKTQEPAVAAARLAEEAAAEAQRLAEERIAAARSQFTRQNAVDND